MAREGPWAQALKGTEGAWSRVEIWARVFLQRRYEGKALINTLGEFKHGRRSVQEMVLHGHRKDLGF